MWIDKVLVSRKHAEPLCGDMGGSKDSMVWEEIGVILDKLSALLTHLISIQKVEWQTPDCLPSSSGVLHNYLKNYGSLLLLVNLSPLFSISPVRNKQMHDLCHRRVTTPIFQITVLHHSFHTFFIFIILEKFKCQGIVPSFQDMCCHSPLSGKLEIKVKLQQLRSQKNH